MKRTEIEEKLNAACHTTIEEFKTATSLVNYTLDVNYTLHFIMRIIERYDQKVRKYVVEDIEHNLVSLINDQFHLVINAVLATNEDDKKIKLTRIKYPALTKQNVLVIKVEGSLTELKMVLLTVHPTPKYRLQKCINTHLGKKYYHRGEYFKKLKSITDIPLALKVLDGL